MTISLAEAKYVGETIVYCQARWLHIVLNNIQQRREDQTLIYYDNNSDIALSKHHVFYRKSKHIDARYRFIREIVNKGDIYLEHCKSQDQLADIFTKPLAIDVFEFHRQNYVQAFS